MDTNQGFITTLKEKELELIEQLEALRTTIKMFDKTPLSFAPVNNVSEEVRTEKKTIPGVFSEANTWNEKILFALSSIGGSGFVTDIADELSKHMPDDKEALVRKVTVYASALKKKKTLSARQVGNKFKYSIK
jgi:hypothetical protein